jgi:hypothetical protein
MMGKTVMGAVVSLDGFMADDNDGGDMAANVIGRRLFDPTNGCNGKPAAEEAIAAAKEFAGDRVTHFVYDVSR